MIDPFELPFEFFQNDVYPVNEYIEQASFFIHKQLDIPLEESKQYVKTTLKESKIRDKYKLNVIALENDDETTTIADPNHIFKEEDYVVVLGSDENIRAFEQEYLNE